MNVETRCQDLSLLVKNYAQDIQSIRNRYKHLNPNYMHFDYVNITDNFKVNVKIRTKLLMRTMNVIIVREKRAKITKVRN